MNTTSPLSRKRFVHALILGALIGLLPMRAALSLDTDIYFSNPSASTASNKPNVLLILDTSGSMNTTVNDGQGKSRLTHMKEALNTILDNAQNVNIGLMRFSSDPGGPVLFPIADLDAQASTIEGTTVTTQTPIGAQSDDAEEDLGTGAVRLDSPDLDLIDSSGINQVVGMRFQSVVVPRLATIKNAFIRFQADETQDAATFPTSLRIKAQKATNPSTFTTANNNVTNRTNGASSTSNYVDWLSLPDWIINNSYTTPDLTSIVQELVDQPGWCGGNSMVFTIEGSGRRVAKSYDGVPEEAPVLVVEYDLDPARTGNSACVQKSLQVKVENDSDDAEERDSNGNMTLGDTALDITYLGTAKQIVGIRFNSVPLPPNATIISANVDFTDRGTGSGDPTVTIVGQKALTPGSFTNSKRNISGRVDTSAKRTSEVTWSSIPDPASGGTITTPDLKTIFQDLVDQPGWVTGGPAVLVFETASGSSGYRIVEARERAFSNNPATLRIVYQVNETSNVSNDTVRLRLKQVVNGLVASGNTPLVDTLYEGGLYYRGQDVLYGKIRGPQSGNSARYTRVSHPATYAGGSGVYRDPSCTDSNLNSSACETEEILGTPTYKSPFADGCQSNYIILLTDGDPTVNNSQALIESLIGGTCAARGDGTCAEELARYYAENDLSSKSEAQNIKTFTVGFASDGDPQFLKDIAKASGTSGPSDDLGFRTAGNASELATAFQEFLTKVKDDPTSFVSPSLSVNAFNKLFNRDEVYFSLFSPQLQVRWPGNVKKYNLCADPTNNTCNFGAILDANGLEAIDTTKDPVTGIPRSKIKLSAQSVWSSSTDGPKVTVGGAGEHIVVSSSRKVYTYNGTVDVPASPPEDLSTGVHVVNTTNITKTQLGDAAMTDLRRDDIINWMLGQDVKDEDADATTTERWKFADALHSRPLTVTYGGTDASPVIKIFVGTNDGGLRLIDTKDGKEEWIVYIPEYLPKMGALMDNGSGVHIKDLSLGLDGTPTAYAVDNDHDGVIEPGGTDNDKVYLYIGERRGGRDIYGFDVTPDSALNTPGDPSIGKIKPKLKWRIRGGSSDARGDFTRLGQTWSRPLVAKILVKCPPSASCDDGDATTNDSQTKNVLIFAGGYDPRLDSPGAGKVVPDSPIEDQMGNAIYMVDPETGSIVWWATGTTGLGANLEIPAMKYAIPSDVALIDTNHDGAIDRLYVGDTRGQLFRIDLGDQINPGSSGDGGSSAYVFADVGCQGDTRSNDCVATSHENRRMFFYPPDVAQVRDTVFSTQADYDLITIASGNREDPLDKLTGAISGTDPVHNRIYAFRDYNTAPGQAPDRDTVAAGWQAPLPLTDGDLYDATANKLGTLSGQALQDEIDNFVKNSKGWFIDLIESGTWIGEKGLAKTTIFGGVLFVTTFVPSIDDGSTPSSACAPLAEGIGRLYAVNYLSGTAAFDFDGDGALDRQYGVGGGIPSEAVIVIREGGVTTLVGTSGGAASPDIRLNLPRYQTYWYEE